MILYPLREEHYQRIHHWKMEAEENGYVFIGYKISNFSDGYACEKDFLKRCRGIDHGGKLPLMQVNLKFSEDDLVNAAFSRKLLVNFIESGIPVAAELNGFELKNAIEELVAFVI